MIQIIPSALPSVTRVAAYCRVSTDLDSQAGSLDAQISHWRQVAAAHSDWTLVTVYSEAGTSATHAQTRPELMKLLAAAADGKIDLVLTKSISRFARNTVDCLQLVRALSSLGVAVFFEKEAINTGTMESELFLSLLSSFAADESRSLSNNVKWGYRKRFERGEFKYKRPPYGYDAVEGELVVNEVEAEGVRYIFQEALKGKSAKVIAAELNGRGVATKYAATWQGTTVATVLRNITYTGDVVLQKTIRDDEYVPHMNNGSQDSFYVPEHHEAIIPREVYILANVATGNATIRRWLEELQQPTGQVRIIEANGGQEEAMGRCKLRVAAYCRVSTDAEEQETSYEAQCSHYHSLITGNPDWVLIGIYADEGISGTTTRHREQFNAMIKDCEDHKIDLILTKSISRFARNTLDCLQHIRRLKALGIAVEFEKEAINTLDVKGEILITIMASIAQQESQSLSQNVRLGIQYRFQQGIPLINCERFLGYDKTPAGKLIINPSQAAVVRRIFRDCLEGLSPEFIGNNLRAEGVKSGVGRISWPASTVRYMLVNEKYVGDLLLQKTYVPDFLNHRSKRNQGIFPKYFIEGNHEPIIPREIFAQVREELYRRSEYAKKGTPVRYGCREALKGRLFCTCGAKMVRGRWKNAKWVCKGCGNAVSDEQIKTTVLTAINRLPGYREQIKALMMREEEGDRLAKAEAAAKRIQARLALEVIDNIEGKAAQPSLSRACSEVEDFWARTRHVRRPGPVTDWIEEDVIRLVEKVVGTTVHFRVGLQFNVQEDET